MPAVGPIGNRRRVATGAVHRFRSLSNASRPAGQLRGKLKHEFGQRKPVSPEPCVQSLTGWERSMQWCRRLTGGVLSLIFGMY